MVVCRYFLQGTCRFGTNCRFDHNINGNSNTNEANSSLRQRNAPGTTTIDVATLVKSVQTDMINSEKGGQWLLSSYGPFKEKPMFPGFDDQSFEEIRFCFYEASAGGTVEQFKKQFQNAQQDAMSKVRALQNPNETAIKTIQQIYSTPVNGQINSIFGSTAFGPSATSPFAGSQNQPFLNQTSVFAPATSPFNPAVPPPSHFNPQQPFQANAGIFAAQIPPTVASSIFTNTASQNTFTGGSIFNAPNNNNNLQQMQSNQQPTSPFGQQATTPFAQPISAGPFGQPQSQHNDAFAQNTSVFAPSANSNIFTQPQTGNIFASALQNAPQQQSGVFSAAMQKSGFPPAPLNAPTFPTSASSVPGVFSAALNNTAANTQSSVFLESDKQNSPFQTSTGYPSQPTGISPFGGTGLNSNIFNRVPSSTAAAAQLNNEARENVYTKSEKLRENEVEAYKLDAFGVSMIPILPPPEELCA